MQPGEPATPLNGHNYNYNNNQQSTNVIQDNRTNLETINNTDLDRGRTRKKRDFFGTLKRRLGRSKSRTKSADRGMIPIDSENPHGELRSISADRAIAQSGNTSNTSTGKFF